MHFEGIMFCGKCGYENPKSVEICQRCGSKMVPLTKKSSMDKAFDVIPVEVRVGMPPAMGAALLTVALLIPGPAFILFHASTFGRIFSMLSGQYKTGDWLYLIGGLAALAIPVAGLMGLVIYFNPQRYTRQALRWSLAGLAGLALASAVFVWEMITLEYVDYLFFLDFMFALGGLLLILVYTRRLLDEEEAVGKK